MRLIFRPFNDHQVVVTGQNGDRWHPVGSRGSESISSVFAVKFSSYHRDRTELS